jgi:dTDP-4-dehydrorhamnose reductase
VGVIGSGRHFNLRRMENIETKKGIGMSLCIIGASGFLGRNLYEYLNSELDNFSVRGTYFSNKVRDEFDFLDITDKEKIEKYIIETKPDFLLWLSGWKPVKCEKDYSSAIILHIKSLINTLEIINRLKLKTRIIFMSSDYVFNGGRGLYTEGDVPNPETNYGKLKNISEQLVLTFNNQSKVIRGSAVMGKGGVFFDWLLSDIRNGKKIEAFSDIYFSPTPMKFFKECIKKIILNYEDINQPIIHLSFGERTSRYDFIKLVSCIVRGNSEGIIPKTRSFVENFNFTTESLFGKDLSLIPSAFLKTNSDKSLEESIREEINQ